jgi:hypothetical protein
MKLKLHNGTTTSINLHVIAGGYDPEQGKVQLIVRGDNDAAGTLTFDTPEATRVAGMLTRDTPATERVKPVKE